MEVTVNLGRSFRYMNVYITTPSSYIGITEGMCGNSNDEIKDDLMLRNGTIIKAANNVVTPWEFAQDWK